jgi:hypothetical protein
LKHVAQLPKAMRLSRQGRAWVPFFTRGWRPYPTRREAGTGRGSNLTHGYPSNIQPTKYFSPTFIFSLAQHSLGNPNRIPPFLSIPPVPHTRRRPHTHAALSPPDAARRPPIAAACRPPLPKLRRLVALISIPLPLCHQASKKGLEKKQLPITVLEIRLPGESSLLFEMRQESNAKESLGKSTPRR